ncbi:hypothetical protein [Caballeronia sordidicola]|uniref:hypothetical protein n=1 Tax=Caballeronia sordidicola TaxID=196367 RepID=UPI0004D03E5F|nr:hypothetical protein [Caballeronia sordidicola]
MPQFHVDADLARLIEKLADPEPFENISFNDALKRVIEGFLTTTGVPKTGSDPRLIDPEALLVESMTFQNARQTRKRAASPKAKDWAASIPSLKNQRGLSNWKAICEFLQIETGGDSARRKLDAWVKENKPGWPEVPKTE